jgi:hypothetical protein
MSMGGKQDVDLTSFSIFGKVFVTKNLSKN